jgi:ACR3 family arsenite transporter
VVDISGVSLPIALGLWLMMLPVLTKVQYELLPVFLTQPAILKQFVISFVLNWIIGPLLMTGLAWACVPDLEKYRNGVIMVGLARCIAMVLIWNDLAAGNTELCAVLVAFNSILQIILYTPFTMFYLNIVSHSSVYAGFWPVAKSVLIFLGVPLVAGVIIRYIVIFFKGKSWFIETFMSIFGPVALISLIYTIIVMFASQGANIVNQIGNVARVAVPMFIYFTVMFFTSLLISWKLKSVYSYAVTQAFTAASNNFELAIAISIATFGVQSNEALAATVGPLIEVPVLLAFVYVALWIKKRHWDSQEYVRLIKSDDASVEVSEIR